MAALDDIPHEGFAAPTGHRLAVARRPGRAPGLFFLTGFLSDMGGSKAVALDAFAAEEGLACTRFDYSGHGRSAGDARDGTIGGWLAESRAVFATTTGPQIVVGSSMGGYLAMLLARAERAERGDDSRVAGLVLIAPAIDMTERLMWAEMSEETRRTLRETGIWEAPSDYGDTPYPITRTLIEEGRNHLLFPSAPLDPGCPVRILQGRRDPDVPLAVALDLVAALAGDVTLTVIGDGDHRLSRPQDIAILTATVAGLVQMSPRRPSR